MILPSENRNEPDAGFTLLETLLTLAILSAAIIVAIGALRGPSPALKLQRSAAEWVRQANQKRFDAITKQSQESWDVRRVACNKKTPTAVFFPDGSALGPDLCLYEAEQSIRLGLDPVLGLYEAGDIK